MALLLTRLSRRRRMHGAVPLSPEAERLRAALLRESDLFHGLDAEQMAQIAHRLPIATCRRGQLIYIPGETDEALFVLKTGRVRVYRLAPDGRKLVLMTLEGGTVFGEMHSLGQSMTGSFAEATTESTLCIMSRVDVDEVLLANAEVARRLVHLLAQRLREAEDKLEQVAFQPVPMRLAELLLSLADSAGTIAGYSHQELADMIGTSRETVSRALLELKSTGLITVDRRSVHLSDRAGVERRANSGG